jgi:hypothetical protein
MRPIACRAGLAHIPASLINQDLSWPSHLSHTQFDNTARSHATDAEARCGMRIDDSSLRLAVHMMSIMDSDSSVAFRGIGCCNHSPVATTTPHAATVGMLRV